MKCNIFHRCLQPAVVSDGAGGHAACLGHALTTSCVRCGGTLRAYCDIEGCGSWKPVGPRALQLLRHIHTELPYVED